MKLIVYFEGTKVLSVERANPAKLEAARYGLFGDAATNFGRAVDLMGADTVASFMSTTPKISEDEALDAFALKSGDGKAFLLVEEKDLPPGKHGAWAVEAGRVVAKAAA